MRNNFLYVALFCGLFLLNESTQRDIILMRTGTYRNGHCNIKGRYIQDLNSFSSLESARTRRPGSIWTERCRNCSCTTRGAWCTGPSCFPVYDFTLEAWCLEWQEDGCCCERLGCSIDGVQYALGIEYSYGQGNPCLKCPCEIGISREYCLRQKCGTYLVMCENAEVTYDENCCPQYKCPIGVTCDVIPDPFPNTAGHEINNWFGHRLEPIPLGMTRHFHLDSFSTYVCRCLHGGTASCKMVTFPLP